MTDSSSVLFTIEDNVARITLNRPEKRNALNETLVSGIKEALREATTVEALRVVVITGAGKDFCSGADLESIQKISEASVSENVEDARALMDLFESIREVPFPVVAAVRGRALAGGCGLASACDLVLAASSSRFGYPEVKIGFVPAMVLAILKRNVSEKRAFELLTRGAEISAEEAKQIGLVNQVFVDEEFDDQVNSYVDHFKKVSKSAVALTKTLLYQTDGMAFTDALEAGVDVNVIARMTADCREGIARFTKK
jgi:methylglutaconyl-CoA hydratase